MRNNSIFSQNGVKNVAENGADVNFLSWYLAGLVCESLGIFFLIQRSIKPAAGVCSRESDE